ncbi:hypothetical protein TL16_g03258 [Triparma laevis f. inornata]|uniref:Uncharacterized protein n=1 Tax=Triparma laevis f. inornata TaxID=1714386 RepID=A0A9W7E055_9STRA|nr:hypothetical protein TL16_g03258 [Triparma laevis f. inornata]
MGNSIQSSSSQISKHEQETQAQIIKKYEEIVSNMNAKDYEKRNELEPNCLALSSYWIQMIVCFAESPIHIIYHLIVYAILCTIYTIILIILAMIDAIFHTCKSIAACVKTTNQKCKKCMATLAPGTNHFAVFMAPLTCFRAFFICLGRSLAHHYFFLNQYWVNMSYTIQVILCPCSIQRSNYLYDDHFIPLKRPPRPVFMRVRVSGGGGGLGDCCDCFCDCTNCTHQCELACTRACDRMADAMVPVGSARQFPQRLTRSMYLGFSIFHPCHPSLVCGPMCDCCRKCYDDYDARGTLWEKERDEKQATLTTEFFRLEYGGFESFDAIVKDIRRRAIEEDTKRNELKSIDKAEMMERGDREVLDANLIENQDEAGMLRRGWRGALGLTYGAINLGVNVTLAPARLTVRGVNYVLGGGGGGGQANKKNLGYDADDFHDTEEGWEKIVVDSTISVRALKLVREGSGGKKRELEEKIEESI